MYPITGAFSNILKASIRERIEVISVYEGENGDRLDAWEVEISISFTISNLLSYRVTSGEKQDDHDHGGKHPQISAIPYYEKLLAILKPWILQISLNATERIYALN